MNSILTRINSSLPSSSWTEVAFGSGTFESEVCDYVFVNKVIENRCVGVQ